jgi:ubiquinone/menaquinone biosynthesis C-methylase UbiE
VAELRDLARSFGRIAGDYDAARPEYAPEALDRAAEALGLTADARVVDLAAGSGTLTRALTQRFADVVAVEPDAGMRAVLEERSPQVDALPGAAERIPLPDDSVDAVFVGDAFHWFDGQAAVGELARVLRPGGGVAVLWNNWWTDGAEGTTDCLQPPLPPHARALLDGAYERSGRAAHAGVGESCLDAFAGSRFAPPVEESFRRTLTLSADEAVLLHSTVSSVASLAPDERQELIDRLAGLLAGAYRLEVTTVLHWTRLLR